MDLAQNLLSFLKPELVTKIKAVSSIKDIPKNTEILKEQQLIKVLPIVIKGLVKVHIRFEEKELLLYYIAPEQSCIMTFYAGLNNTPSKVFAVTEEDSEVLLIPIHFLPIWLKEYPELNELFYHQFNLRYTELVTTIGHLLKDKMDKRLLNHLKKKTEILGQNTIKMSHTQLANELGTAREVISRVLKKLENEGKVSQQSGVIKVI